MERGGIRERNDAATSPGNKRFDHFINRRSFLPMPTFITKPESYNFSLRGILIHPECYFRWKPVLLEWKHIFCS